MMTKSECLMRVWDRFGRDRIVRGSEFLMPADRIIECATHGYVLRYVSGTTPWRLVWPGQQREPSEPVMGYHGIRF